VIAAIEAIFSKQLELTILLDTLFDLPSLEGVEQVMISQQVIESTAGPLYIYAARTGGARAI